jgi:hypothetical protein
VVFTKSPKTVLSLFSRGLWPEFGNKDAMFCLIIVQISLIVLLFYFERFFGKIYVVPKW